MFSDTQFWVQLSQIIIIDILLSGDNAVVIALAARSLPPEQQRWAILGGTAGAVAMRIGFAAIVVYLMDLPYLKLIGALLLLWIAVKMLMPEAEDGHDKIKPRAALWSAIGTIMMADAVMSVDNVIGVAAAAKGSILLLAIGIAISIPICIFGATLVLKLLTRFPFIVTLGCGLLGWVAGDIGYSDPALRNWTAGLAPYWHHVVAGTGALFVVAVGHAIRAATMRRRRVADIAE